MGMLAGQAFGEHGDHCWDRGAEDGGDGSGQSHSSGGKGAIEDGEGSASGDACREDPGGAARGGERGVSGGG